MAQTIVCPLFGHFLSRAGNVMALADQVGTSAAQQLVNGCRWFLTMISLKTFVVGTGTSYPVFAIEVADDANFTVNVRRLDDWQLRLVEGIGAIPAAVPISTQFIAGFSPDNAKLFWRVKVLFSGTSTCVYDIIMAAAA